LACPTGRKTQYFGRYRATQQGDAPKWLQFLEIAGAGALPCAQQKKVAGGWGGYSLPAAKHQAGSGIDVFRPRRHSVRACMSPARAGLDRVRGRDREMADDVDGGPVLDDVVLDDVVLARAPPSTSSAHLTLWCIAARSAPGPRHLTLWCIAVARSARACARPPPPF
jgi:hypothetical protein